MNYLNEQIFRINDFQDPVLDFENRYSEVIRKGT